MSAAADKPGFEIEGGAYSGVGIRDPSNMSLLRGTYGYSDISTTNLKNRGGPAGGGSTKGAADLDDVDLEDTAVADEVAAPSGPQPSLQWIILPHSTFRNWWLNIQLFIALYIIFVIPIRVGYDMGAVGFWFWMEGIINIFFIADLVFNFFVAYENKLTGVLVTDHKLIAHRYLLGWFIIDLLAVFPSDYIVKSIQGTWECSFLGSCTHVIPTHTGVALILILRGMRLFRVIWIFKNFSVLSIYTVLGKLQDELYAARWIISITELLLLLAFLGHLTSCFFYMLSGSNWQTPEEQALIAAGEMNSWIIEKLGGFYASQALTPYYNLNPETTATVGQDPVSGLWFTCARLYHIEACPLCGTPAIICISDFSFFYRYITALYWAYTTMTTVGYGDIVGVTTAEKIWCIITMIMGGFFLSFCFGRMASVMSRLDADREARASRMDEVTHFIKDVDLPRQLSRKVMDVYQRLQHKPYDKQAVLARLPFDLRTQVLRYLYMDTLKSVPLLQSSTLMGDDVFFGDLCIRLRPQHSPSGTFVYQRGELGSDVFILLRGDLHVLDSDRITFLFRVPPGTLFGEAALLRQIETSAKVVKRGDNLVCFTDCDMLRIASDDMVELCEAYPNLLAGLRKLDKARALRSLKRLNGGAATSPMRGSPTVNASMAAAGGGAAAGLRPIDTLLPDIDGALSATVSLSTLGPRPSTIDYAAPAGMPGVDPALAHLMTDFTARNEALQRHFLQQVAAMVAQQQQQGPQGQENGQQHRGGGLEGAGGGGGSGNSSPTKSASFFQGVADMMR